jgi:hypothetical protein
MTTEMRRGSIALFVCLALAASGGAALVPTQTKKQAEVNVLHALPRLLKPSRLHGLVNPRTHLLADGTEAICRGRGTSHPGRRFERFVCVVRPSVHKPKQGLYVGYRARAHGRFAIRVLLYRRR